MFPVNIVGNLRKNFFPCTYLTLLLSKMIIHTFFIHKPMCDCKNRPTHAQHLSFRFLYLFSLSFLSSLLPFFTPSFLSSYLPSYLLSFFRPFLDAVCFLFMFCSFIACLLACVCFVCVCVSLGQIAVSLNI
jgi:hypothetical protein